MESILQDSNGLRTPVLQCEEDRDVILLSLCT